MQAFRILESESACSDLGYLWQIFADLYLCFDTAQNSLRKAPYSRARLQPLPSEDVLRVLAARNMKIHAATARGSPGSLALQAYPNQLEKVQSQNDQ